MYFCKTSGISIDPSFFWQFSNIAIKVLPIANPEPFKVANNISMMVIDHVTGKKAMIQSKKTIIEAYKNIPNETLSNLDINNRFKNNSILRFY